jgi:beta-glucuronidase
MDVISFNRYNAWYFNSGRTDTITQNVIQEAQNWHKKHNKPVLMTEYGADTMAGLHLVSTQLIEQGALGNYLERDQLREHFFRTIYLWDCFVLRTSSDAFSQRYNTIVLFD